MKTMMGVHFRSGRQKLIDIPDALQASPEELAEKSCDMSSNALFFQIGPHLLFIREIERIEYFQVESTHEGSGRNDVA